MWAHRRQLQPPVHQAPVEMMLPLKLRKTALRPLISIQSRQIQRTAQRFRTLLLVPRPRLCIELLAAFEKISFFLNLKQHQKRFRVLFWPI